MSSCSLFPFSFIGANAPSSYCITLFPGEQGAMRRVLEELCGDAMYRGQQGKRRTIPAHLSDIMALQTPASLGLTAPTIVHGESSLRQ